MRELPHRKGVEKEHLPRERGIDAAVVASPRGDYHEPVERDLLGCAYEAVFRVPFGRTVAVLRDVARKRLYPADVYLGGVSREEAIARMTSVPARRFGIAHRGVIEKGAFADLAIWKEDEFASKATYVEPHQFSSGVKAVVVNGAVSYADGKFSANRTGRFLERKQ